MILFKPLPGKQPGFRFLCASQDNFCQVLEYDAINGLKLESSYPLFMHDVEETARMYDITAVLETGTGYLVVESDETHLVQLHKMPEYQVIRSEMLAPGLKKLEHWFMEQFEMFHREQSPRHTRSGYTGRRR